MKLQLRKPVLLAILLAATVAPLAAPLPLATMAQAAEYNTPPPAAILQDLRPGAISVAYEPLKIGPKNWPAALHISVVPKAGVTEDGSTLVARTPTTQKELFESSQSITLGITPSPFYIDVYAAARHEPGAALQRVNSITFTDRRRINSIVLGYLKPKQQQGPMLFVGYSDFRNFSVRVFTFPEGLRGRVVVNEFLKGYGGAERGTKFDIGQPDKGGNTVLEESAYSSTGTDWVTRHTWNGKGFVEQPRHDTPKPFLVIAGMSKDRAELEALREKLSDRADWLGKSEVLSTKGLASLPPDSYVLVLVRCPTQKSAAEHVAFWNQSWFLESGNDTVKSLRLSIKNVS